MKTSIIKYLFFISVIFSFTFCSNDTDVEVYEKTDSEVLNVPYSYTQIESDILELVNQYRDENNLSELITLNYISTVADSHTNYMVKNGALSHDNFQERVVNLQNNAKAKSIGENVAFGFSTAKAALNGWLNSPEHKKIIDTESFTHFGISTNTDKEGRIYFTQIFIKK